MPARKDSGLVRDWPTEDQGMEIDPGFRENSFHLSRFEILSQRSHEPGLNSQARQIRGDVACASCGVTSALDFDQGDWGFVGNAHGMTFEVTIQNKIADDEQFDAGESADDFGESVFSDVQSDLFLSTAVLVASGASQAGPDVALAH